ncbi:MAG: hypothetical protein IH899_06615 [Planctomycetes bacterium]|nr:hypothetical protein [Planctomycetota bacterium]
MRTITSRIKCLSLTTGLIAVVAVANLHAGEPSTAGVVRISDKSSQQASNPTGNVQPVAYTSEFYITNSGPFIVQEGPEIRQTGNCITDWFTLRRIKMHSRRARLWRNLHLLGNSDYDDSSGSFRNNMLLRSRHLTDWHRCKFGYFYPTGCCGTGCPIFGTYNMVYAVDPQYFDERDGKLYSAQGYGVPMAVPLAPTVRHAYNYGWGIPSSRRTPVSRVAPQVRYINPQ